MISTSSTVSTAVARVVAARSGAVFGLMGNGNAHMVAHLTATGAPYTSVRHEAATVAAAHAYYLARGQVAAATTTYGAGFTNAMTALAEAHLARIPLVLVTGDAPAAGRRWWDVDQTAAATALGVPTFVAGPTTAEVVTARAFDLAERDRTPVVVAVPEDLATAPVRPQDTLAPLPAAEQPQADGEQVRTVARLLRDAARPLVLVGRGAHLAGAGPVVRAVGDEVGALFAGSVMAMDLLGSAWDLGVFGGFTPPRVRELVQQADVVLAVGIALNDVQMGDGALVDGARELVQVDIAAAPTHDLVTRFVRADASAFGLALLEHLRRGPAGTAPTWRQRAPQAVGLRRSWEGAPEHAEDGRLDPRAVARALDHLLPQERTVVQDGGHFIGWLPVHATVPDPCGMLLVGTAYQTIGLGFASGVGAAVARPERTTVLVTGDGGGLMGSADMTTFLRTARSGVLVVLNDAAYGAELHQYGAAGLDTTGMLIEEVDFAAMGRAMGAEGRKVRSLADLAVLEHWVADGARGVLVLDVAVSRAVVADYLRTAQDSRGHDDRNPGADQRGPHEPG